MEEKSVNEESAATAADGKNYRTRFYSLEAIIAVGYRVQSPRATQFRTWATDRLKDYILKGFALDGEQNVARSSRSNAVNAGSQKSIGTIVPHWNDA